MRYLKPFMAILMVTLVASCSWWPFGSQRTGNCLDDGTCEGANPFEEQLVGGTWYCYGVARDEPWDCSQEEDPNKVVAVNDEPPPGAPVAVTNDFPDFELPENEASVSRAEMTFNEDEITSGTKSREPEPPAPAANFLDAYSDDAWAIQLIALQSRDEVESFVAGHQLSDPKYVQIESGGAIWYVLILDVFEDRASADSAAEVWETENNPSSRPWVRPVRSLKAAARRADS